MKTMRVAMYYNNNDVRIEEMPIPEIRDNELLVKVMASGICGSDVMEWYRMKTAPRVLGHEIAGDIVKVGKKIQHYKIGERVFVSHHVPCNTCKYCLYDQHTLCDLLHSTNFYPGGFAEYLKVPEINVERGIYRLPDDMTYEEGSFIEPLGCVVRGLRIAEMNPTQNILIIGSGISGLLHVKVAKAFTTGRILSTDINQYRLDMAKGFGANAAIPADQNVPEEVRKHNNGELAGLVVTCTGAPLAVTQAIHSVNRGGTILFFAPTKPGIDISFPLFALWNKGVKMVSTYAASPKDLDLAIDLIRSKKVTVTDMITHRLSLSETPKGFKLVEQAQDSLKVVIEPHK
jgi:L-iditol 2-dehydrogenase